MVGVPNDTGVGVIWWWGVVCPIRGRVWLRGQCGAFTTPSQLASLGVCKFSAG